MTAPDKLYIGIQDLDSGYAYDLSLDNNGEQEYIRKDALIEWLENKIAENEGGFVACLTNLAYQDVLDKLISL